MFRHLRPCTSSVCQLAQSPRSAAAISPAASVAASSTFPACKTFCHADRIDLSSRTTSAATYTSLTDFADAPCLKAVLVLTLLSLSLFFYCIGPSVPPSALFVLSATSSVLLCCLLIRPFVCSDPQPAFWLPSRLSSHAVSTFLPLFIFAGRVLLLSVILHVHCCPASASLPPCCSVPVLQLSAKSSIFTLP